MTDPDEAAREARRKARANWPIRKYTLGDEPPDDVSHLSPEERLTLLSDLSVSAWLLSGRELPRLPRSQWPGVVNRGA